MGGGNTRVGWIARLFLPPKKVRWPTEGVFRPPGAARQGKGGGRRGEVLGLRGPQCGWGPPGEGNHHEAGNSQQPPILADTPAPQSQRHSSPETRLRLCTLSVSHSRGLERHSGVPIKPLGAEDSSDSRVHKDVHADTHT